MGPKDRLVDDGLVEAIETLVAVGPPRSKRARAVDGEYETWQTEGDDFGSLCWAIEVLRLVLDKQQAV